MKKRKMLVLLALSGLLTIGTPVMTASAAWKTTSAGKIYTQTKSPGYVTGHKKISGKWYYFDKNGIMQTGFQKIGDVTYFYNSNGTRRTGWLTYGSKKLRYYFNADGIMQTGVQTIDKKMYYFNESGAMQRGWIQTPDKKKYYGDKNTGELAADKWVENSYFQEDGTMAVSTWIDGKWVGPDGRYTGVKNNVGWITDNGKTYYYDSNSKLVKGWLHTDGKTYYLDAVTGVLQKGWIKVSGKTYFAGPQKGVILKKQWLEGKYLTSNGSVATGWKTIGKKTYYFSSAGKKKTGWIKHKDHLYYFNSKGVLTKSTWVGNKYANKDGMMAVGFTSIDKDVYYFNAEGEMQTGWVTTDGKTYFLSKDGKLQKKRWLWSKTYYAGKSGAVLKGMNAIGGKLYYFDPATGKKKTSSKIKLGKDTYFFQKDGTAAKNKWITIKKKQYYFQNDGKMAKSTWINGYFVDADGVRTGLQKTTGWSTVNGRKYYFDGRGNMVTGMAAIGGKRYYFDKAGEMITGIYNVGSKKYYFHPDGHMASEADSPLIIGTKQYTFNSNGVVTSEKSVKVDGDTKGTQIVNYALQFVGNPYVYGGTDLKKGADCSGFTMKVFEHFGYKLLRVADDQMHGPSSANIKNYGYTKAVTVDLSSIQPGDLLFYGDGGYAGHVAIYMGNGKIVHASNSQPYPKGGIKVTDDYMYRTPLKAVRYWD